MTSSKITGFDFYNPFFTAFLTDREGRRVSLQSNAGLQGNGASQSFLLEQGIEDLPYVESVTVNVNFKISSIRVDLSPPYPIAEKLLSSGLLDWGGNTRLSVQFGYIAGPNNNLVIGEVHEGLLLNPSIKLGSRIQIGLVAQGLGGWSSSRDVGKVYSEEPIKYVELMELLMDEMSKNNTIASARLELGDAVLDNYVNDLLNTKVPSWSQGGRSNYVALMELAREVNCYVRQHAEQSKGDRKPTAVYTLVPYSSRLSDPDFAYELYSARLGDPFSTERKVFPIISVSSPTTGAYLSAGAAGIRHTNIDPSKGAEPTTQVTRAVGTSTTLAPQEQPLDHSDPTVGGGATASDNADTGQSYDAQATGPQVDRQVIAEHQRSRMKMGINLNVGSLGNPLLRPGMVVKVNGLGDKISGQNGNYYVFTVTHRMGVNGYDTQFTAVSNSTAIEEAIYVNGEGTKNSQNNRKPFVSPEPSSGSGSASAKKVSKVEQ